MSRKIIILVAFLMSGYLFIWGCLNENEEPASVKEVPVIPEQLPTEMPGSSTIEQPPTKEPTPFVPEQPSSVESKPVSIINVDDVVADPIAYDGVIGIRGIVSFVYPADSTFVIIDVKEYELCGVVTCAINEMSVMVPPDQYSGELPKVEDEVVVYSEIISQGDVYSLDISEVKRAGETILKRVTG